MTNRKSTKVDKFDYTDFPAALEISEECCDVLEQAADWLAISQDRHEELKERMKWGQFWLLNSETCRLLNEQERNSDGKNTIKEFIPAAELLNLKNWLNLAEDVFMNPGEPREEDNWTVLAEDGETPGIRATAFQDFYSLTVSITKRLVATVLFCTSSKLRALDSKNTKQAHVTVQDVEAAVKILGMKTNWRDYWINCPRRCNLKVYHGRTSKNLTENMLMTYDKVERELAKDTPEQSLSQPQSQSENELFPNANAIPPDSDSEGSSLDDSDNQLPQSSAMTGFGVSDLEDISSIDDDSDSAFVSSRNSRAMQKLAERKAQERARERAEETHAEAFDMEASKIEEQRLWDMLKLTPPPRLKTEQVELPVLLKENDQIDDEDEGSEALS